MGKPPESARRGRRVPGAPLSREDAALWRRVADGIRPLKGRRPPPEEPATGGESDEHIATPPPPRRRPRPPVPPPPAPAPSPTLPEIGHGDAVGLDKRTAQRMRRGQLPIEGRIDLHGLTEADAHRALTSFLIAAQNAGRRCVIVVTGKGLKADGRPGVLRANVPRWLNQAPNRGRILAFCHAQPRDGGEGALYVLLRRNKSEGGRP